MEENNNHFKEEICEFKGGTNAKLDIIYGEIKGLRKDVDELKNWKAYTMGIAAVVGFIAASLKDWFFKQT